MTRIQTALHLIKLPCVLLLVLFSAYCDAENTTVYMGILIKDNDAMIPAFLKSIQDLEYDKNSIYLKIDLLNDSPDIEQRVSEWCNSLKDHYLSLSYDKSSLKSAEIKTSYLHASCDSDFLFIVESDAFLKPYTLKILTEKNASVVVPLLRPLPTPNDSYRNFFHTTDENGFYKDSPCQSAIAERKQIGTFPVDCVSGPYLIKTSDCEKLSFQGNALLGNALWDYISFSNQAKKSGVPLSLCNEREFGFFIHQEESPKNLTIPALLENVSRNQVNEVALHYNADTEVLAHIENFPIDSYTVFPVVDELYWVDEKWDWVKSHYIKKGLKWEPHIQSLFDEYVSPGDTVIDIGGHIGTHTIHFSKLVDSNGSVHVFEPQAKLFTELIVNASLNHCDNIYPHHFALGSEEKEAEMECPCSKNEGMNKIGLGGEKIAMKTLDSFKLHNVRFIKIDIEGYELEALKGGHQTIQRDKPVMIIEIFKDSRYEQKMSYLKDLGYNVQLIEDNDYLCLPSPTR